MEILVIEGPLKYDVGDDVEYELTERWRRIARVVRKYENVKKGEPGFECLGPNGEEWWGYAHQIVRVVRHSRIN